VATVLHFTEEMERRLLGGADILLMPSLYEPCGIAQMRAQRYGPLPLARRVGGLGETITDGRTGFLFDDFGTDALRRALDRGCEAFSNKDSWASMVREAMRRDFSWCASARAYTDVYDRAARARHPSPVESRQ
jgi:starch synthase